MKSRQLLAAAMATTFAWGGQDLAQQITGLAKETIRLGTEQFEASREDGH